jgi:prephenate dehydratase
MNKQKIAYQGVSGAYSHLACQRVFPDLEAFACEDFQSAILMVERGDAQYAMIPLENSTAGRVEFTVYYRKHICKLWLSTLSQ